MGGMIRGWNSIVSVACALLGSLAACAGPDEERPSFLVVSIDTLNRSALRAFDPEAAALPAIDALADESLRFQSALSTASWTLPAHASLVTGLYPDRHGATDRRTVISDEVRTLGTELGELGYETVAFTGGAFLDGGYGFARGFDVYESVRVAKGDWAAKTAQQALILDRCVEYLTARDSRRPFLLFAQTYVVHNYYNLREEAVSRLEPRDTSTREEYVDCVLGVTKGSSAQWRDLEALYQAEVELLDASVGKLMDALEREGLLDNTVVLFVSDHGEGFAPERGRIHHGGRLHADQIRIPMLLRIPGRGGADVTTPVSLVDVVPTLRELAGGAPPEGLDGRSLVPLIAGEASPPERDLFAMEHSLTWKGGHRMTVAEVQAKPIGMALVRGNDWYIRTSWGEELYEIDGDARQERDLTRSGRDLRPLRSALDRRRRARPETRASEADPELKRQLEAMGYAE